MRAHLFFVLLIPSICAIPIDPTSFGHDFKFPAIENRRQSLPVHITSIDSPSKFPSLPIPPWGRTQIAQEAANKINTAMFNLNPEVATLTREKQEDFIGPRRSHTKQKLADSFLRSKDLDTVAVQVDPNGRDLTVAMNTKEKTYVGQRYPQYGRLGYQQNSHRPVIQDTLSKIPQLQNSKVTVIGPKIPPANIYQNAAPHAEMQLLSHNKGSKSKVYMGVSKEPCANCVPLISAQKGHVKAAGGTSLDASKIKNWNHPSQIQTEVKDSFPVKGSRTRQDRQYQVHRRPSTISLPERAKSPSSRRGSVPSRDQSPTRNSSPSRDQSPTRNSSPSRSKSPKRSTKTQTRFKFIRGRRG